MVDGGGGGVGVRAGGAQGNVHVCEQGLRQLQGGDGRGELRAGVGVG